MILQVLFLVQLLIGLVASMNITRILQAVEEEKCSLLQIQTTMFLMNMMIGPHVVIGLAICFRCLLNNRRNGNGNILSEEDECSRIQFSSDVRMSELNKCRRIINKLYKDIGTINVETMALQYRIDTIFGEDCRIDKSIVHRVLKYFGLA